jgi:N utilization substance protein A
MKSDFIIALTQLAAERNLPREIVLSAIEAALAAAYRKDSVTTGQNISVRLDPASGDVSVYLMKSVVEEVTDPQMEISLSEAQKTVPDAEIGQDITTESLPHSAGRIAAQTAKQVVIQRLREAERELVYEEFADKEGEVFAATVQRIEPKQAIVELGRAEAILPVSEQAPYERFRVGLKIKVLLQSIRRSNKGPEIIVSRTDKMLLKRLFEMEVPEIFNGAVEIVDIAREAGSRSKVAVWAKQDGVDAVGSCVGLRGIRIQNIVNELHGEKIDVVQWNKDPATYISSALSPSTVMRVDFDEEAGSAVAIVPDRQISLAIGKEGQNARLAARLTGWKVDIKSNVEADAIEATKAEAAPPAAVAVAPAPVEAAQAAVEVEPKVEETVEAAIEEILAAEPVAEVAEKEAPSAADETKEAPAAKVEPAEEQVAPEKEAVAPEPPVAEKVPPQLLVPELEKEPEPVPVGEASTSIQDLPDAVWAVRRAASAEPGAIRFAEDIAELRRGTGSKRGRGNTATRKGGGQTSRGRKTKAGRRR